MYPFQITTHIKTMATRCGSPHAGWVPTRCELDLDAYVGHFSLQRREWKSLITMKHNDAEVGTCCSVRYGVREIEKLPHIMGTPVRGWKMCITASDSS